MSPLDSHSWRDTSQLNGFSANRLDRRSERRAEDCVAEALRDGSARLYLFAAERALLDAANGALAASFDYDTARRLGCRGETIVLLGQCAEGPRLAALVGEDAELPPTLKAIDLRSLAIQGAVPADDLGAIAQARALLHWHATNGFCARCGAPSAMRGGGVRRECTGCGAQAFPRVDPVAIMLAIDGERCLLGRQRRFAPGMYSALAGFIEPGETVEDAVRREVKEEAGIEVSRVAYLSSQPWPFPSSLMIGCHCEALTTELAPDLDELEDCRWFDRDEVRLMLEGAHPDELKAPPAIAIAHRLIRAFAR
ncbi:MAG TPA: NAD(+) diphosphatase [Afifellaceae bacterium]|nr:NAD(+) diphosphatase [Afifellaceae bacterium]